jgi:putative tryptophan/tyrosine transport system substrate-binding protein
MKRREFITLLGGAAAWPLAARAQQSAMPLVGILSSAEPPAPLIEAYRQGLNEFGYVEGKNFAFERRRAGPEYKHFRALADELVHRQVAVIFAAGGTVAALAAKAATATIPIVFYVGGDPVTQGLVISLNRPGGNLTGVAWLGDVMGGKRLELLHEIVPNATVIGMLVNSNNPDSTSETRDVQEAARILGQQIHVLSASNESDFEKVFTTLVQRRASALIVATDPFFSNQRARLAALARRHSMPAIYDRREFVEAGGLISYGHHRADAYHQLGVYTGRILKGAKPADLPVLQPTKFELTVNLKTAKALGLTVPPALFARADDVIE